MSENQDAVAQQLAAIGAAQVVEAGHLLSSEASTGGKDQQDGVDSMLGHGHGSAELTVHLCLACCCIKQACKTCCKLATGLDAMMCDVGCGKGTQRSPMQQVRHRRAHAGGIGIGGVHAYAEGCMQQGSMQGEPCRGGLCTEGPSHDTEGPFHYTEGPLHPGCA